MKRLALVGVLLWGLADLAIARPMSPRMPRDPAPVRAMQRALRVDWRACEVAVYPGDIRQGASKASSTVTILSRGRRFRAKLEVDFHNLGGTSLPHTSVQSRFKRCVESRFARRRFRGPVAGMTSGAWGLSNPFLMNPVVDGRGEIGRAAAHWYVEHHLEAARRGCGVAPDDRLQSRIRVVDGKPATVTISGHPNHGCVEKKLATALRFPVLPASVDLSFRF